MIKLKLKEPLEELESNSVHGHVIDMFETRLDFINYLRMELYSIKDSLETDNMEDKELNDILDHTDSTFYRLYSKYLEYNFDYTFEIV